eukprot:6485195-Prymnesium_polylepis.2
MKENKASSMKIEPNPKDWAKWIMQKKKGYRGEVQVARRQRRDRGRRARRFRFGRGAVVFGADAQAGDDLPDSLFS